MPNHLGVILDAKNVQSVRHRAAWLAIGQMVGRPNGQLDGGVFADAKHRRAEVKAGLELGLLRAVGPGRERGGDLRRRFLRLAKRTPLDAGFLHAKVIAHGGVELEHLGL